ncbi:thiol-disulfide oxidoreductase DCC family protein [Methylacidiphilum caldifontis]|uniref:Thiol-disulfide oxidoreductase n=1 Tax=Methylacidiphilum caldifontis TaxID=2795386 RepID=A0A4Y8PCZ1_9BACT|nr:DCC1-like thiol-disulfide oxidoreductase family protein [Methylacidiphilum caldifontis]QSR87905.1 DUF393 domain-containing protein [Methylacidiphilum caldifontis]TFE68969.1 thiol-disulfide oxidoreductase [Methylacidiphilum caldifontis]
MNHNFSTPDNKKDKQIIFFDGICALCNSFVSFVLRKDKDHCFVFAPRQGKLFENFKEYMSDEQKRVDSIVLCRYKDGRWEFLTESKAVIEILKCLAGFRFLAKVLGCLPRPFLDKVYRTVAKNRYQWFGKRESCRLPTAEERKFFFD